MCCMIFDKGYENKQHCCIKFTSKEVKESTKEHNKDLRLLAKSPSLKLLQEAKIRKAFDNQGSLGLFRLFITNSFMSAIRNWTNKNLKNKGLKEVNEKQFRAYIGLEMAMSIVQLNDISYYWKTEMFTGHEDFKKTMSRDEFMNICASIELRDPESYNHNEASADPLWHARKLLEHFQKKISQLAVPTGSSALDEASIRTKCRSRARSYMPCKPDKYTVRFYALVGTKNAYLSSIVDNRSGNYSGESGPESFCRVFQDMRTPYNNFLQSRIWSIKPHHQLYGFCKWHSKQSLHMTHQGKVYFLV